MKIAHHNPTKCCGFTLIEILVVMAIITILAGMVFGGASAAMNSARKADARNTAYNVRNAVSAYLTEYRRLPYPFELSDGGEQDDFPTDEQFMDILLGANTEIGQRKNPRGIAFFTGRAARQMSSGRYIRGIAFTSGIEGGGSLWDPYGSMYGVRMDLSNRNRMLNPYHDPPSGGGGEGYPQWGGGTRNLSRHPEILGESCVVWSGGKDTESSGDNVTTW